MPEEGFSTQHTCISRKEVGITGVLQIYDLMYVCLHACIYHLERVDRCSIA